MPSKTIGEINLLMFLLKIKAELAVTLLSGNSSKKHFGSNCTKQRRILLTLATGTGKTAIAFQIAWKLFQTRWNLNRDGKEDQEYYF